MPINYPHWSFGKKFIETERCISTVSKDWPMKSSLTLTRYRLPDGRKHHYHASAGDGTRCYGHNSFFKNNYLFRSWTDAVRLSII